MARALRLLTEHPLKVAPELLGQPLASPRRRLAALVADSVLLILPSVAVALGVALAFLHHERPEAFRALMGQVLGREASDLESWKALAPWLVELDAPGLPAGVEEAVKRGDLSRAAALLEGFHLTVAMSFEEGRERPDLPEGRILVQMEKVIPRPIRWLSLFGLTALYFTLMTSGRKGATFGKRAAGIRVAHLGGERLTLLESFERFAGYLEIPASFGLALLALWKDPNRRMPHDRVAGTVVLRVQKPPRPPKRAKAAAKTRPAVKRPPES